MGLYTGQQHKSLRPLRTGMKGTNGKLTSVHAHSNSMRTEAYNVRY